MDSSVTPLTAAAAKRTLLALSDPARAELSLRYFKTGPGQYGEGDLFLGISVPKQRQVAKQFRELPLQEIEKLLQYPQHECRLTAIFILVDRFRRSTESKNRAEVVRLLLANTAFVNNWDLVDSCASQIVGEHFAEETKHSTLWRLFKSQLLWEQRMAIVANAALIRRGDLSLILSMAEKLLDHPHDLIHKAAGWMLREVGNRDERVLIGFLNRFADQMPRTMLRYSIEKLPPPARLRYLAR